MPPDRRYGETHIITSRRRPPDRSSRTHPRTPGSQSTRLAAALPKCLCLDRRRQAEGRLRATDAADSRLLLRRSLGEYKHPNRGRSSRDRIIWTPTFLNTTTGRGVCGVSSRETRAEVLGVKGRTQQFTRKGVSRKQKSMRVHTETEATQKSFQKTSGTDAENINVGREQLTRLWSPSCYAGGFPTGSRLFLA